MELPMEQGQQKKNKKRLWLVVSIIFGITLILLISIEAWMTRKVPESDETEITEMSEQNLLQEQMLKEVFAQTTVNEVTEVTESMEEGAGESMEETLAEENVGSITDETVKNAVLDTEKTEGKNKCSQEAVRVRNITVFPGEEAIFRCYESKAEEYQWEYYSVLDRQWENVSMKPEYSVYTETDELDRLVSCLKIPEEKENDSLSIRCTVLLPEAEKITSEGALHLFQEKIKSISVPDFDAEAGKHLSALELKAIIEDTSEKQSSVTGLQNMVFCVDQDEEESTVHDEKSSVTTETHTKTYRESAFYPVKEGEQKVRLKCSTGKENFELEAVITGTDTSAPEIADIQAEYCVSGVDVPVPVKIYANVIDNYSLPSEISFAFGGEKEPDAENWNDELPLETEISQNGIYYLYARDAAGNIGRKEIELITVDMKAPVIDDVFLQTEGVGENIHRINVVASDKTEMEYCFYLQGESSNDWQKESSYLVQKNGEYVIKVRDAAGNVSEDRIAVFDTDTTAPVITGIYEVADADMNKN